MMERNIKMEKNMRVGNIVFSPKNNYLSQEEMAANLSKTIKARVTIKPDYNLERTIKAVPNKIYEKYCEPEKTEEQLSIEENLKKTIQPSDESMLSKLVKLIPDYNLKNSNPNYIEKNKKDNKTNNSMGELFNSIVENNPLIELVDEYEAMVENDIPVELPSEKEIVEQLSYNTTNNIVKTLGYFPINSGSMIEGSVFTSNNDITIGHDLVYRPEKHYNIPPTNNHNIPPTNPYPYPFYMNPTYVDMSSSVQPYPKIPSVLDTTQSILDTLPKYHSATEHTPSETKKYKYNEDNVLNNVKKYIDEIYLGHHYKSDDDIECFDAWIALGSASSTFRDTALKYLWRYGNKDGNNQKDLVKAIHYIMLLIYNDHYKNKQ